MTRGARATAESACRGAWPEAWSRAVAARAGLSRTWDAALAPAELLAPQLLSAAPPCALPPV